MAKTAVYFELALPAAGSNGLGAAYTVPAGKHLIVTNHRAATRVDVSTQSIVVNGGETGLVIAGSTYGRLTGAILPSGTTLQAAGASTVKQSISGYLVDN